MGVLAEGPMRLLVDGGERVAQGARAWGSAWEPAQWPSWALWMGLAMLVILVGVVVRRVVVRPRDPYERLLRKLCDAAGVSAEARTRLMMQAGGDAERATGLILLRAMREAERVNP